MRIFRIRDTDGDDQADEEQNIAWLETQGNYPHNGLCGLSFDNEGRLLFGLGENLGKDYILLSADGSKLSGGGEGGNIYRCQSDGTQLQRIATGFWNPFGISVDPRGRIFCVGNDPDSMPPCRLMHIVNGGDYGYQFRYGRSGKHPLQAWDGELPGTLPMVAGTGEAPCAVLPYRGQLWVTSWGDYRIERYTLQPRGASFGARLDVAVQGDETFRPVDFALAPDGSLYFTDWVDRSYPVHGRGRIWKLTFSPEPQPAEFPELSAEEALARNLKHRPWPQQRNYLGDPDPFIRNAAIEGFSRSDAVATYGSRGLAKASERVALLEAGRRSGFDGTVRHAALKAALQDVSPAVRLYALRWIADSKLVVFQSTVEQLAKSRNTTPALFQASIATLEWLAGEHVANLRKSHRGHYFADVVTQSGYPDSILTMALRSLPPDHESLTPQRLLELSASTTRDIRRAAVRTLTLSGTPESLDVLASIAGDPSRDQQLRADAVLGLKDSPQHRDMIVTLPLHAKQNGAAAHMAALVIAGGERSRWKPPAAADPADPYLKRFSAAGKPDIDAGWRSFFGYAQCSKCHTLQGRGGTTGPDLTFIARRMDHRRLVQSIIQPSREIAPRYVPWILELKSGKTFSGIALNREGRLEVFASADGTVTRIPTADIAGRHPSRVSVMPDGIVSKTGPDALWNII
ncbi:MAG: PVC-type heme-binding CxxCH protein, partial [Planctomycetaceae bacterium]